MSWLLAPAPTYNPPATTLLHVGEMPRCTAKALVAGRSQTIGTEESTLTQLKLACEHAMHENAPSGFSSLRRAVGPPASHLHEHFWRRRSYARPGMDYLAPEPGALASR